MRIVMWTPSCDHCGSGWKVVRICGEIIAFKYNFNDKLATSQTKLRTLLYILGTFKNTLKMFQIKMSDFQIKQKSLSKNISTIE